VWLKTPEKHAPFLYLAILSNAFIRHHGNVLSVEVLIRREPSPNRRPFAQYGISRNLALLIKHFIVCDISE